MFAKQTSTVKERKFLAKHIYYFLKFVVWSLSVLHIYYSWSHLYISFSYQLQIDTHTRIFL